MSASPKSGPASMATRQARLAEDITRRFENVRQALLITIEENNALGITNVDAADSFPFETPAENIPAFVDWWNDAVDEGILEPTELDLVTSGRHWTAQHIDSAYADGIRWGDRQLVEAGRLPEQYGVQGSMRLPAHQKAIQTVRTRAYSNLQDITTDMEERIAELLTEGVNAGGGPGAVGATLSNEVEDINNTRGLRLARTEIMNSHANATAYQYQQFGVQYADVLTSQPCPVCDDAASSGPYPVDELRDMLPFHPNCVCTMVPAVAP